MKKLLISFSGGRTSAYMTKWLLDNMSHEYEMKVVFANTGKEREETLEFVDRCDKEFGLNTVWIEAVINPIHGVGTTHQIVNFDTANRDGKPFEDSIAKYGMPNVANPHCTRDLKTNPIHAYIKSIGWTDYYTAIGIRDDEAERVSKDWKKNRFLYPLIQIIPTTQSDVNKFWVSQSFDLQLKSYEGNCDLCFKKSTPKLLTIIKENKSLKDWWLEMEKKYENYVPKSRDVNKANLPIRFFRQNMSITNLVEMSSTTFKQAKDISQVINMYRQCELFNPLDLYEYGCGETCEPFS